jgi:hypothetical protein
MTGNLAEHTPDPQPLIARYYEALGFFGPSEWDPKAGTYSDTSPARAALTAADVDLRYLAAHDVPEGDQRVYDALERSCLAVAALDDELEAS